MKRTLGIFAHVDAGKTTFSENLLHITGALAKAGRVDHQNTLLDSAPLEKRRGITIYSGIASFSYNQRDFYLLDTPGHVDFSAEMERALSVIDGAILLVSAIDGVQSHTITVFKMLRARGIPVYIFMNKMDIENADLNRCLSDIEARLMARALPMNGLDMREEALIEAVCETDDVLMEQYLNGALQETAIVDGLRAAIKNQRILPLIAGSALRGEGISALMALIDRTLQPLESKCEAFSAQVFKTIFDKKGQAVNLIKCLSGTLRVKQELPQGKVHEIRNYQGENYTSLSGANAGDIVGVTGLIGVFPGSVLGANQKIIVPALKPVLHTGIDINGLDVDKVMACLRRLEAQDPLLQVRLHEDQVELLVMGKVQIEVLEETLNAETGLDLRFGKVRVVYQETIAHNVMGYGHFEPLRHYSEVHLRLEPNPNKGIEFISECSVNDFPAAYQHQVRQTALFDPPVGILTGSPLNDIRFVLTAGAHHVKHTEGGDFREATRRAIRQALEKAESVLLEPYCKLLIDVDAGSVGRVLSDLNRLYGEFSPPESHGNQTHIEAHGPLETLMDYPSELLSITKGTGAISIGQAGYRPAHDPKRVIEESGYDPVRDINNPSSSVFCAKGAGFEVKWREAEGMMHLAK